MGKTKISLFFLFMLLNKLHFMIFVLAIFNFTSTRVAYPIFAQQTYKNPREANGRIVCANCHLAQKPVELEVPQAVLPSTIFEAVVRIPFDSQVKQVTRNGKAGDLNVGAVLVLPNGFQLAPSDQIPEEIKKHVGGLYFQPYSAEQKNILVIGPVPGKTYQKRVFPVQAPDPKVEQRVHYLKYPVYLGGNRGRGQVYPDGSKSNNTVFTSPVSGTITNIEPGEKGSSVVTITKNDTTTVNEIIPAGPEFLVKVGDLVEADQPLTNNPNVGGFGQADTEIVLQNPLRVQVLIVFLGLIVVAQIFLVLKKKQFEKVQLAE